MQNKIFDVIFGDRTVFDIKSLAFFEGEFASSPTMFTYSLIIAYHPGVLEEISKIRERLSIQKLFPYPDKPSFGILASYSHEQIVESGYRDILETEVKKLKDKLRLPEVWTIPLTIKILTGVLPVPYEHNSVEFSYPKSLLKTHDEKFEPEKLPTSLRDLYPSLLASDFVGQRQRMSYPCLVIKEYVKPNKINEYVKRNWKSIESVLLKLPKRQHKSRDKDLVRFTFGVWLFTQKRLLGKDWGYIDFKISEFEKADEDFFSGENGTPSTTECQKLYDEIVKAFAIFYPL